MASANNQPVPTDAEIAERISGLSLEMESMGKGFKALEPQDLNDEQKGKVQDFKKQLSEAKVEDQSMPDEFDSIKYLQFHAWDTAVALKAYLEMVAYRKSHNVDTILERDLPHTELFDLVIPYALHGFAKNGDPIYLEKTGAVATQYLHLIDKELFLMHHVRGVERMRQKLKQSSEKHKKRVSTVTSIIDLSGLNLGHRNAVHLLQYATQFDGMFCPGLVGNVFVLNLPWFAPGLWELVKMFLPVSVLSQIHVLGPDYKTELLKYIDADELPEEYGGTCKNVVKVPTEDELKAVVNRDKTGLQLHEKQIAAGDKFEITLKGEVGQEFVWSFEVDYGYDVGFTAYMTEDGSDKPVMIKPTSRCTGNKGSYVATKNCTVKFEWDNSYSYWNAKYLKYHASVGTPKQ